MTHPFSRRLPLHCKEGQCEDVFVAVLSLGKFMFSLPLLCEFLFHYLLTF